MRLPQIAIYWFHGRNETWKRYPQISRSTGFFHMLKINEIDTDSYVFMSWKQRQLKEVPSHCKINWILPHFENEWDCHRLLFTYCIEKKKLERGTLKSQDRRIRSHVENKWDCHRLLFVYFMEKKLERDTFKFQDQPNSSTFWK